MGSAEVNAFLTHLAVEGRVSASTQNQALSALLFLYRELLERDLDLEGVVRARQRRRLPVVLSEAEVRAVRRELEGDSALVVGSPHAVAREPVRGAEAASRDCSPPPSAGSGGGLGSGAVAPCLGEKVPPCQSAMGLAMGVSSAKPLEGCGHGKGGTPPPGSESGPKGGEASRWARRPHQTRRLPHFSPFIRDPFARAWAGHPNHSGINGAL